MMRRLLPAALLALAALPAWAQDNPSFNVVNRTSVPMREAFASPAGIANWGRNRLAAVAVPPGGNAPIRLPADGNCIYDVRVVYANGQSDERRGVNTCSVDNLIFPATTETATPPARSGRGQQATNDDPSFRLVNRSRSEVNEVYASLTGNDDWGVDQLGEDTIAPGATRVIRLPSGPCTWDVRIVWANGEAAEKRRLNLCTVTDLRVP